MRADASMWFLSLILVLCLGCSLEYCPTARDPAGRIEYRCQRKWDDDTASSFTIISRNPDAYKRTARLCGDVVHLAVGPEGVLAALVRKYGPYDQDGQRKEEHELVFLDGNNLRVTHQWKVGPRKGPFPAPPNNLTERIGPIALSYDGKTLAAYRPAPLGEGGWNHVVGLWQVASGKLIRELPLSSPSDDVARVLADFPYHYYACPSSLAFSPDSRFVALCFGWCPDLKSFRPCEFPAVGPPDRVLIWRTSDGAVTSFEPKGHSYLRDLCFNSMGTRLASWELLGVNGPADILVWSVPEGRLILRRRVRTRVLGITHEPAAGVFRIWGKGRHEQYIDVRDQAPLEAQEPKANRGQAKSK